MSPAQSERDKAREEAARILGLWINNTKELLDEARAIHAHNPRTAPIGETLVIAQRREALVRNAMSQVNATIDDAEDRVTVEPYWDDLLAHIYLET